MLTNVILIYWKKMQETHNYPKMTSRLLTIPSPNFVPYMEKHRLYEFFYELMTQLLIQQPEDPVIFMKQCITHAIQKRDVPRVVLIAPPNFDKMALAIILQEEIGIQLVTLEDLYVLTSAEDSCRCCDVDDIASRMKTILISGKLHKSGWILVDIPRNKKEARALQSVGVIPTHAIQIIPSCIKDVTRKRSIMSNPASYKSCSFSEDASQSDYKRTLRGLREAYTNILIEVEVGMRTMRELGKDCAALTKIRKHYGAPSLFRIVLIGPRGSDLICSLAKHTSERFNLVHVDFDYILEQVCLHETALGEFLRLCEHRCGSKLKAEAKIQIVKKHVLQSECLKRGWILTGYPTTVEEFKLLDMIPTPPNRVIVIEEDVRTCEKHSLHRQCDNGNDHSLTFNDTSIAETDRIHSKNQEDVQQDLCDYEESIKLIMRYAGETAIVIDGKRGEKFAREKLEACLMRSPPIAEPRVPQPPPTVDPMDVEYDPDDEPDPSVFDDIREPEPKFSFI